MQLRGQRVFLKVKLFLCGGRTKDALKDAPEDTDGQV